MRRGFSLAELAVVVVILGVLAGFAVPRFLTPAEHSRAAEAFHYLSTVQAAQERYHAREGTYAADTADLDLGMAEPEFFAVGRMAVPSGMASLETGWQLALTRAGAPSGYGQYTVVFNHNGFDPVNSTIDAEISLQQTREH